MNKLFLKKCAVIVAVVGVYLSVANYYIYFRIGNSGLKPSDNQYTYTIGNEAPAVTPLTYVALGDSLTAGTGADKYEDSYPYLVAQKMAGDGEVALKDFSIPGARTSHLIDKLLVPAIAAKPDVVTVLIGTNDIHGKVGAADFEKNYRYIIENLQKQTDAEIFLVSIPFIGSDRIFLPPYNYYFRQKTVQFNEIIVRLSKEYGVNYIDIATPTEEIFAKDGPHYAVDSFHPSADGYKLWAQIIYDHIHQ